MANLRPFRFGVIVYQAKSKDEWVAKAQRAENLGYSTFLVPDHLEDQLAAVPALVAAAEATSSIRLGSSVFDNDFRHPVMLAKEAATIDLLSGGRFELGIGAGWAQSEYEQAGISFDAGSTRVSRLEEALHIIKGLFAEEPLNFSGKYYTVTNLEGFPKPIQRPHPPIFVGGGSKRILSIAAREANIVGFGPRTRADGSGLDVTDATSEATERKVAWVRQVGGERFNELELNTIVFTVVVTYQRQQASEQLTQRFQMTAKQVLEMPHCLVGTVDQITEDLLYRREKFGISYVSVFDESMETFAPVVARLVGK
ncbi:MAG: LLM class F420-dependent oxidoreductase [Ktedonobacteraceae bacterium]